MRRIVRRLLDVALPPGRSAFLWGPRRVRFARDGRDPGAFIDGDDIVDVRWGEAG